MTGIRDRLGDAEFERQMAAKKVAAAERRWHAESRRIDQMIIRQFNDDNPGGCQRCGEDFDAENAEVVTPDGTHLTVHASCIGTDALA